ncbi:amidase family protein [Candidatus Entotheonella palauensis]|uniref:Amidase domain-containing protein n=1 Tax=Candidatus Entotheonella gemina TaxID=1429439 RepID=W4MB33_9BACT|nr:amidase family protein [Candidatus Entotheonella palauensis]ETX07413.1 MAG: hypothetical protein ETSY2_11360 [Candidatus Entotheonella gemina]
MDSPIWRWSAVETAAAIRQRNISCTEAVQAALERLRTANDDVNAITVDLSEEALATAQRADGVIESGMAVGPLHGVPITIKENTDQQGQSNPNGIPGFAHVMATEDAPIVANLRRAGAIIIGRTNTPEFSYRWFTDNPLRGLTANPWAADRTPGGSSGGAATAVVLGMGDIAHGNDLGGSLRYPAYACGAATIRPSLGRIAAYNASSTGERPPMIQLMSVQGPIAREVRDVRLALRVMANPDARDPWWQPAPMEGPRLYPPIRVALTEEPAGIRCHPSVAQALDTAAQHLERAGYAVEAVNPPWVADIAAAWRNLLMTDTQVMTAQAMREHGSDEINQVLDGYMAASQILDLNGYINALADRTRLLRAWSVFMETYPLVLAPVSQVPPFQQLEDLQGTERVRQMLDEQSMLYSINLLGLPAAAVPTGVVDGVPIGVQIIGPRFREDLCLDAAQVIETGVGILARQLWERES